MARRVYRHREKPWGDRSWESEALPPQTLAGAAIAEPGTVPDNMGSFKVAVVTTAHCNPPFIRYLAYTGDRWMERFEACCEHGVSAASGDEAKKIAIEEHKEKCAR